MLNTRHRLEETLRALERLAKLPNIYAKLTCGTHGSYRVYPFPDMHDPLKRVIAAFGPERCVWGSNFPNALWSKGASYAQNLHLFVKELGLSLEEKSAILGGTAMQLWFPHEVAAEGRRAREQAERTRREAMASRDEEDEAEAQQAAQAQAEVSRRRAAEVVDMAALIASEGKSPRRTEIEKAPGRGSEAEMSLDEILEAADELDAMLKLTEKGSAQRQRNTQKPARRANDRPAATRRPTGKRGAP
jgi:hypothetical protein